MMRLSQERRGGLSLTLVTGILVSLRNANGAMRAMLVGLNIAYETNEKRSFVSLILVTQAFTLGLIMFLGAIVVAMGARSVFAAFLGPVVGSAISLLRWPVMVLASAGGLCVLYRFGPCRPFARWRWITWGSGAATVGWLATSMIFSIYLTEFANLGRTYGSLATAVGLMLWIWLSATIVLIGAELNAEIERDGAAIGPDERLISHRKGASNQGKSP